MSKVREMVSSDTVIGQPITTPDGVTLVPVSRLSFGFTCGGSDFGKQADGKNFAGGTASAVKVDPVAFLVVSTIRMVSHRIQPSAVTTSAPMLM